ncbi:uncharacterized protein LOC132703619 [Cylas formicarius]|uniref:uncharacterized protein LOC132703619 n=1 Tax=Cylas formicarius TaxID=197179 RepID=UPI00295871AF|nr:uncharacterized protein LOC132703619 [Cylas formicarius]
MMTYSFIKSAHRCHRKWLNLGRAYRRALDSRNTNGEKCKFRYFDTMHKILGSRQMEEADLRDVSSVNGHEEIPKKRVKVDSNDKDLGVNTQDDRNSVDPIKGGHDAKSRHSDDNWSKNETLLLISLYSEHEEELKHAKKKKLVWQHISEEMMSHSYLRSPDQCQRKWLNLCRGHRKLKNMSGRVTKGRGGQPFRYFDAMDEILGTKEEAINSGSISSQAKNYHGDSPISFTTSEEDSDWDKGGQSTKYSQKRLERNYAQEYYKMRLNENGMRKEESLRRHNEFVAIEREKIDIEREKVEVLKQILAHLK